jgi:hypothetical protein
MADSQAAGIVRHFIVLTDDGGRQVRGIVAVWSGVGGAFQEQ